MRNRSKLLLAGLTAALMLATAVSTASAGRLEISEREFRAIWSSLTFDPDVGGSVICPVTLGGSFHSRTIRKTINALIGAITSAAVGACGAGTSATVLTATLPWHLTYNGFEGRLPTITGIRLLLIGAAFQVQSDATCLARTDVAEPAGGTVAISGGQATTIRADENFQIDLDTPGFICDLAGDASFSGTGNVRTPSNGLLFIRLI
jgi:hypothetical protein